MIINGNYYEPERKDILESIRNRICEFENTLEGGDDYPEEEREEAAQGIFDLELAKVLIEKWL